MSRPQVPALPVGVVHAEPEKQLKARTGWARAFRLSVRAAVTAMSKKMLRTFMGISFHGQLNT
jgi:hypothetical protein